jgi:hypothetical protein
MLDNLHSRLTQVEATLGMLTPEVEQGLTLIGAILPGASPVINAVKELLATLNAHWQGKLALPTVPDDVPGHVSDTQAP